MNNVQITRLYDFEVVTKREMNNLEIAGATTYIYTLLKEWYASLGCEFVTRIDDVIGESYYCNKTLQINNNEGYVLHDEDGMSVVLDSVFMIEGNNNDLFGYAYECKEESSDEEELFLVRI